MIAASSWVSIYPEIVLLFLACVVTLADLLDTGRERAIAQVLSLLTLAGLAVLTAVYALEGKVLHGFSGTVVSGPLENWLKCFSALSMLLTFVYGRGYVMQRGMLRGGEWYVLGLLALLGIFVLISADSLLLLYLGLECLTLSSCALVALRRDNVAAIEAAMKYFVLGSVASGFLLYGMSMLYGATGTLGVNGVLAAAAASSANMKVLSLGLVFIVAGLAFKIGAAPFHMWVPDVYQGAPTAVSLLIGTAPKLAAYALMIRLLVQGLLPLAPDWQQMLVLLAVASLLIGNLAAIVQTNIKRMLAYSTISHMGFVLMGILSGATAAQANAATNAYSSAMFYMVTYVLTTLVSFGMILLLSRDDFESEEIVDFAGLNQRAPLYAGIMAACMFSLAGLPPLVGFQSKLLVLQALLAMGLPAYTMLAVFAALISVVAAFYYLRVVKIMYFDEAPAEVGAIEAPLGMRALLSLNGAALLLLGILPGGLMALCSKAIAQMLQS